MMESFWRDMGTAIIDTLPTVLMILVCLALIRYIFRK